MHTLNLPGVVGLPNSIQLFFALVSNFCCPFEYEMVNFRKYEKKKKKTNRGRILLKITMTSYSFITFQSEILRRLRSLQLMFTAMKINSWLCLGAKALEENNMAGIWC